MTVATDIITSASLERADLVAGLREFADWVEADRGTLPVVNANFRTGPREGRTEFLRRLAERLGVRVTPDRLGNRYARRWFGPLCAEGHISNPDASTSGYLRRVIGAVRQPAEEIEEAS